MSSSRNCLTVHATGGEVANHLCMRESCSDPMVGIVEALRRGCIGTSKTGTTVQREVCDAGSSVL
jgi:hypothetical protein